MIPLYRQPFSYFNYWRKTDKPGVRTKKEMLFRGLQQIRLIFEGVCWIGNI